MHVFYSRINATIIITLSLILSACMVGPNFRSPPPPPVERYTQNPLPKKTASSPVAGGAQQTFITNEDIPILWWELYHSPEINELVKAGLANNPNLAAASAALREAQENVNVQIGNSLWPAINTTDYAQRQKFSQVVIAGSNNQALIFNLYNASVNISYTLDIWGGARREIESLRAQVDYQQFEVIAAYLTLTSNIVTTAVTIASYEAQIKATEDLIRIEQGVLGILNKQFQLGAISNINVLTQLTTLEQTKASLPPLQKSMAQAKHALAALVGAFPDRKMPVIDLNRLQLPKNIPVSIPSNLVRQRPDIRASEALLHAACAQIGVATANLLPQLTMTGSYGWISTILPHLISGQNNIWSIMGQVVQPIFQGGALLANRRGKIAAFQQAAAQYRQTVLVAFENVADTLRALETDARALQAQARAENAARRALDLTLSQYRLGGINYIDLLNAQHQYQQTRINRIQAQAIRFNDTAALFQALGGGWWHKPWCVNECR